MPIKFIKQQKLLPGKSVLCLIFIFIANITLMAQSEWTESSFEDFIDGWFLDAGSNIYVSKHGRMQMINRWDLNGDGYLDIVLPSGHGHTERENIYIYLNNGTDIDGRSRIEIPGGGSRDGLVADFNKDGFNDLAVVNNSDSHFDLVNSWIYYGSEKGFTYETRTQLPAYRGTSIASGDFNRDSWLDVIIACQWQEGQEENEIPTMSLIYWNSPQGFSKENRHPLIFDQKGADVVTADDLDGDGASDIVALAAGKTYIFLSKKNALENSDEVIDLAIQGTALAIGDVKGDGYKDIAICTKDGVVIVNGEKTGFENITKIGLKDAVPKGITFADINSDDLDDLIIANFSTSGGATWTHSYIFLSDGEGYSHQDSIHLPSLGARDVSAGDLNGDGFPELVFSNERITNQNSLLSYIYWNNHGTFKFGNHSQLQTQGSVANTIGDVNNDGRPDLIFFNHEGWFRDGPALSYVYWGNGTRDFSTQRRTSFHTHHIFGLGHADLDDDGHVDLMFAQERFVRGVAHEQNGIIVHWGSADGFVSQSNLSMISAYGGVHVADINKDGYLDILAGGVCMDLKDEKKHGFPIFWGSAKGFSHQNRTVVQYEIAKMRAPLLMDLNRDGWLDIAGQVENGKVKFWWGNDDGFDERNFSEIDLGRDDHLMYIKGADFNKDGWLDLLLPQRGPSQGTEVTSFIYYGTPAGYSNSNRIEIKCYVPYENSIADFNGDGWLDIFLTSYGGEVSGNRPSLLYWGSADGFDGKPRTELPTYGSSGSEAADYDGDGWLDLFISNHRQSVFDKIPMPHRHTTNSMLYWGGPNGFSPEQRWEVQASGPSGLNLRDLGNSYDRGLYEDYISSAYRIAQNQQLSSIRWQAEMPLNTEVRFQVRLAKEKENLSNATWQGPDGLNTWFSKSGTKITNISGRWIQYRARLITPNGGSTPYLTSVTLSFK